MPVRLVWQDNNTSEEGHRVYRSTSPMDPNNLPAPLAALGVDVTEYIDDTVTADVTYYYRVSAYKGAAESVSSEVEILASDSGVPTLNLDLWYKMTDISGTLVPDSAGTNDGSLTNGPTVVSGDLGGSAVQFDGVDDYIDTGYKTSGGNYTISAWVNVNSLTNNGTIYGEVDSTSNSYGALLWFPSGVLTFGHFKNTPGDYDSAAMASSFSSYLGQTVHICAVREDGVANRLYLNGTEVASEPCTSSTDAATFTGKIGGNPDFASQSPPRWLDGVVDRDFRIYDRALSAQEVADLYAEHEIVVPFTLDENTIQNTECEDINDFVVTSGNPSIVGSELVLDAGDADRAEFHGLTPPASGDFVYYFKMRATAESGKYNYLYLYDGATVIMNFIYNYNLPSSSAELGTVSVSLNSGAQKMVLETGIDTSVSREYCIWVDRDRGYINFFLREADGWKLLNTATWFAAFGTVDKMMFGKGSGSESLECALDYFSLCRPNFVSIGDSITAGHNHYDPVPSFYAGLDDVRNSWQGHWNYAGLRNNFMVNKGIGSQDSGEVLARISEATSHGARYVFLSACNNDYGVPLTQTQRTNNIQGSIDAIVASGSRVVLYNAVYPNANSPTNPGNANYYEDWWVNYRGGLTDVYQEIDIMQSVVDGVTGYIDTAYCESDGVHPNLSGYTQIGQYMEAQFNHTP